ncbi:MAG: NAD(P)H-dependent flavin oxidoreductase [Candidatus Lokiarchaeia archaeon]
MLKTRITELFGIKHPILCGGMHRLAIPKLCAAVSNAGGMGSLTASTYETKEEFVAAIREVRKLTEKPFWCNVTMLPAVHLGEENYKNYLDAIIEENVPAVEISGMPVDRLADGEYMDKLLEADVKLVHKVGSVRHAKHAEKVGYRAVIAAGVEEGGHPLNQNVATTVLTTRIAESVNIPVITTGGMVDGRGLAAALCLGAEGIMMATRFMCTEECDVHPNVKEEIIRRQEYETVLYGNTIGLQGRALLNDSIRKVMEIEDRKGGLEEILPHIAGTWGPEIWEKGNMNVGLIPVGQSIGLINDVVSCKELLDRIVKEAEEIINRVKGKL